MDYFHFLHTRSTLNWFLYAACALWCLHGKTADGTCEGESRPSDAYYARGGSLSEKTPCCFPFMFNGKSYSECVITIPDHDVPWCSTDSQFNDSWGNCHPDPATPGGACFGSSSPSKQYFTQGGTVDNNTACCFPFWYDGIWRNECIKDGSVTWCAVDSIYTDYSDRWGNCVRIPNVTAKGRYYSLAIAIGAGIGVTFLVMVILLIFSSLKRKNIVIYEFTGPSGNESADEQEMSTAFSSVPLSSQAPSPNRSSQVGLGAADVEDTSIVWIKEGYL